MAQIVETVLLETTVCYSCACLFAWPAELRKRRLNDRKSFWCPNGHEQHFTGPSEADRLRTEVQRKEELLEAERARVSRLAQERDRAAKAHNRMRTRIWNGVCPCCNRTFQNLMQHMRTEHAGELNLRNIRTAYGMTQEAVAAEIGITGAQVSLMERGKPVPEHVQTAASWWLDAQAARAPKAEVGNA